MTLPRVVIVGGGLAGLSAAEAISTEFPGKFQVTLIEAKRKTGGRTGSFTDPASGESIDYCQHVAMGCCTNFCNLMTRGGLMDRFRRDSELVFLHPDHAPSEFSPSKILPPPLHLARTLSAINYLTPTQKKQVRFGLWRLMRAATKDLMDVTAADWLSNNRQEPSTIADYWDVILVSALGEETKFVTMAAARKVFMDGFASARGASDVLIPRVPLSELFGKNLADYVQNLGVEIKTGDAVRSVTEQDDRATVTLISGQSLEADHVISAVPWYRIDDLLSETSAAKRIPHFDQFSEFPTSPISGVHLWFDRPIADRPHAVMVGTLSQWLFRDPTQSDLGSESSEHYYQVVISASQNARDLSKQDLVERVVSELEQAFPEAKAANLLRHRIVTDPKSVFSIRPEIDSIRPESKTGLPWLHLAGDWVKTGWPATMEGAVISGRQAANSVLANYDWGRVSIDDGLRPSWLAKLLIRR